VDVRDSAAAVARTALLRELERIEILVSGIVIVLKQREGSEASSLQSQVGH
jgi:hypothetical protein